MENPACPNGHQCWCVSVPLSLPLSISLWMNPISLSELFFLPLSPFPSPSLPLSLSPPCPLPPFHSLYLSLLSGRKEEDRVLLLLSDCWPLISMADWNLFRANCWRHLQRLSLWCMCSWGKKISLGGVGMATLAAVRWRYGLKGLGPVVENPFVPRYLSTLYSSRCRKSYLGRGKYITYMNWWYSRSEPGLFVTFTLISDEPGFGSSSLAQETGQ